ncbi:hypothetical protein KHQ08_00970 (plasmid) [Pseudochrobactrum algeriensis]|uniref:Uncharacterized protein n=1 Tax=Pseudochrobactrum saccharolyticum TaxID=354352 RepID=A0A7W8AJE4_9HYPH|nr:MULTISPECIES: hypothetical protein [Pseudochrobactrum]MBX8785206.1 hypothetical protein [Ochrobactrum sp. GRS2]MBB5091473.1 hypothetical protein [Pseudochrobactrum saccharolyticum]QVQ35496.1 hypothetical protein KHQ08_00970 [Pseudochrobactrum algeriensis]QVQ42112.1 hypothetical protein KHQ07_16840 [Pseudochrobactrum algeriensis]QVQ42370.1 hypothetical protein KHQ09_01635 [Pseudochrobactrum algeriensis]
MSDDIKFRTSKGIYIHYCLHKGCKNWGAYGFKGRFGTEWFCFEHKDDGLYMPK